MKVLRRISLVVGVGRAALVAGLLLAAAAPLRAQDKPPADKPAAGQVGGLRFVDVAEITVVNVDVAVANRSGPVLGLTKDDFEIYQDGKRQDISNFMLYAEAGAAVASKATPTPAAAPVPPPAAPPAATDREPIFLALYIDNENVAPLNRNRVLARLNDFVTQRVKPPDQAMLIAYQRSLKVLQPFTSDPDEILEALRKVKVYSGGRVEADASRKDIEDEISSEAQNGSSSTGSSSNSGPGKILGEVRQFAQEQQNNLRFTVDALKEAVTMMGGLPGRKFLVYVSDGLPMTPGLELYYEMESQFNLPSVLVQAQEFNSSSLFRGVVTAAAASGVTIYAIDCRGLDADLGNDAEYRSSRSTSASSVGVQNYQEPLLYMADQTGGRALINTNDPTEGMKKVGTELATYYSLGYRLTPTGQDRVHRVEVKVKGNKTLRLAYRKTFIEKSLPTRIGDRVVSGLAFDIDDNPLGITVTAGEPTPASGGRWLLPVEVRVPLEKVAMVPDGEALAGYISVYYAARDQDGKQSDLQHIEQAIKIPAAEYDHARTTTYMVGASLLLEPGKYRISVGLRDQLTNQAGYAVVNRLVHPEKS
jgi:VWFA-related protein